MKLVIPIEIECGEKTCIVIDGEERKVCPQLIASHFGTQWHCHLFSEPDHRGKTSQLEEKGGWLQRTEECLKLAVVKPESYFEKKKRLGAAHARRLMRGWVQL